MSDQKGKADLWPERKYPTKWVVVTHFYDTLAPNGVDPNVFGEKPFDTEEAARTYATKIKTGMGYGTTKVEPPVS